jgi:threonine aldolase
MPLYVDGARLGYGLMSDETDVSLADLARLCDAFSIGGTKVGALCGEAVVFPRRTPEHLLTTVKLHGALLAKGRLLGVQFDELFTDELYFRISRHAIDCARKLKEILREKGCTFYLESPTNQQFLILENQKLAELQKEVAVSFWEKYDETHTVVRLATSWSTTEEDLERLRELL